MAVVKNLMVRAGADFSGMRREMAKANKSLADFKSGITKTMKGIAATLATLGIGAAIKDAVKDAMSFEAAMQQIDRQMGASADSFREWAKANAAAMGMSKLQVAQYGATYANLISNFSKSTAEVTQRTEELLKASAIVASSTGRSMQDVMERIRSGMLGETDAIEDLGINVNVAMLESTKAFRQFAGDRSWQQLSFQTQQQIMYYAILEQASRKYGNEIADNTITRQQQLVAQLNNTKLALGQAFLPIYNSVLPALIKMATALANAASFVAQFMQALFGGGQTKQQTKQTQAQATAVNALGDAYKAAGKKAKGAVAGFDQVNLVGGKTDGASADAGAGAGAVTSGIDESALSGVGGRMEEVSQKAREMAEKVKKAFGEMKDFIVRNKAIILSALAGLAAGFATFLVISKWSSIVAALTTGAGKIAAALRGLGAAFAVLLSPAGLIAAAIAGLVAAFVYFYQTNEQFRDTVQNILQKIGEAAQWLWQNVMVPFGNWLADVMPKVWKAVGDAASWLWDNVLKPFGAWLSDVMPKAWDAVTKAAQWLWKNILVPFGSFLQWLWNQVIVPLAKVLGDVLGIAFKTVADIAKDFWQLVLVPLGKALKEMFGPAVEAVSAVLNALWKNVFTPFGNFLKSTIKPIIETIIDVFVKLWKSTLQPLANYVANTLVGIFREAFGAIGGVVDGVKQVFIGLMNFITGVFTGDWRKAWEGVKKIFQGVMDGLWAVVKAPLNLIIDGINKLIDGLNKIKVDVPGWVEDVTGYSAFGISIPRIPRLAKGGLAYGPTLAMVGDNRGAASNPEVISPLSDLQAMIDNSSGNREVVAVLKAILTAIKQSGGGDSVSMSKTDLARAASSGLNDLTRRTGRPTFNV